MPSNQAPLRTRARRAHAFALGPLLLAPQAAGIGAVDPGAVQAPPEPPPTSAEAPAARWKALEAEQTALRARVEEREREAAALRERLAAQEAAEKARVKAEAEKKPGALVSAAPGKGITVLSADKSFELNVRARAQIRDTLSIIGDEVTNEINVKTVRLNFAGHALTPDLRYRVQLAFGTRDFEANNASPLFDAYVEYTGVRDANVRVGQFFVPFDRARTTREFALQLVDRQLVVRELTLDRDVGVMISSDDLFGASGKLGYHVFLGGGEGRNRFGGAKLGPLAVGRLVFRPFGPFDDDQEGDLSRSEKPHLAVGVAGAYNHHTDRASSTYGDMFKLGTFNYVHGAADLVFKAKGFSLFVEGLVRKGLEQRLEETIEGEVVEEYSRTGYGYFAQAGMMLTKHLEIAGRWEQLFTADGTDPAFEKTALTQGNQIAGGLNLYLNGHAFKIQSDYVAAFRDAASDTRHLVRVQLDATF